MAKTTAAKKEKAAPVKKAPVEKSAKASEVVEEIVVQFGGEEWNAAELAAKAKADYVAEGHRASAIKKFVVYLKPEDRKAYYVVNEKTTGSIDF